jgi:hypothetical protein
MSQMHTKRRHDARKALLDANDGACMSPRAGVLRAGGTTMTNARTKNLETMRLPDLQARFQAVLGEATRCPNRVFLIRRIRESLAESKNSKLATARPPKKARAKKIAETPTRSVRGRFTSMTIEELQTQYASAVGRATGSTDRRYLTWKIREAERGRVPIGPRATRTADQEAHTDVKILPLRLDADAVERIDSAWRNAGMKSRMEFFRRALGHFFRHLGLRDGAALFA